MNVKKSPYFFLIFAILFFTQCKSQKTVREVYEEFIENCLATPDTLPRGKDLIFYGPTGGAGPGALFEIKSGVPPILFFKLEHLFPESFKSPEEKQELLSQIFHVGRTVECNQSNEFLRQMKISLQGEFAPDQLLQSITGVFSGAEIGFILGNTKKTKTSAKGKVRIDYLLKGNFVLKLEDEVKSENRVAKIYWDKIEKFTRELYYPIVYVGVRFEGFELSIEYSSRNYMKSVIAMLLKKQNLGKIDFRFEHTDETMEKNIINIKTKDIYIASGLTIFKGDLKDLDNLHEGHDFYDMDIDEDHPFFYTITKK